MILQELSAFFLANVSKQESARLRGESFSKHPHKEYFVDCLLFLAFCNIAVEQIAKPFKNFEHDALLDFDHVFFD